MRRKDLSGRKFGQLTVIRFADRRPVRWECLCDCGEITVKRSAYLLSGETKSCGCRKSSMPRTIFRTHGMSRTRVYGVWCKMIERCHDPRSRDYRLYGARGISVCERWRHSFESFSSDMGERPAGYVLDRKDLNGPYAPGNCRWTDLRTSSRNRRGRVLVTAFGETKCVTAWLDDPRCKTTYSALVQRVHLGWDHERAIATPSLRHKRINA